MYSYNKYNFKIFKCHVKCNETERREKWQFINDIYKSIFCKVKILPETVVWQGESCFATKGFWWKMHVRRIFLKPVDGSCAHSVVAKTRIWEMGK